MKEIAPKRILIVDDEQAIRRLLADLFTSEGYVVSVAENGARALECLHSFSPDVVICDLMMPVMNGWSFADRCRAIAECANVPIIAMSAIHEIEDVATSVRALGVRAFMAKPFDVDTLLSLLAEVA